MKMIYFMSVFEKYFHLTSPSRLALFFLQVLLHFLLVSIISGEKSLFRLPVIVASLKIEQYVFSPLAALEVCLCGYLHRKQPMWAA